MNKNENVVITKDKIYEDPYNYEFEEMCNVLEKDVAEHFFSNLYKKPFQKRYQTIFAKHIYKSHDTIKYVYELADRRCIETVCIKRKDGLTACVSTQVGCPVQCVFCESGRNRIYQKPYRF